jgi:hypothetical protein
MADSQMESSGTDCRRPPEVTSALRVRDIQVLATTDKASTERRPSKRATVKEAGSERQAGRGNPHFPTDSGGAPWPPPTQPLHSTKGEGRPRHQLIDKGLQIFKAAGDTMCTCGLP